MGSEEGVQGLSGHADYSHSNWPSLPSLLRRLVWIVQFPCRKLMSFHVVYNVHEVVAFQTGSLNSNHLIDNTMEDMQRDGEMLAQVLEPNKTASIRVVLFVGRMTSDEADVCYCLIRLSLVFVPYLLRILASNS